MADVICLVKPGEDVGMADRDRLGRTSVPAWCY